MPSSLSAASAPSFIAQLALPTSVQSPILLQSINVTQPSWLDATLEYCKAAAPTSSPAASIDRRFIK